MNTPKKKEACHDIDNLVSSKITEKDLKLLETHYAEKVKPGVEPKFISPTERAADLYVANPFTIGSFVASFVISALLGYVISGNVADAPVSANATATIVGGPLGLLFFVFMEKMAMASMGTSITGSLWARVIRRKHYQKLEAKSKAEYSLKIDEYRKNEKLNNSKFITSQAKIKSIVKSITEEYNKNVEFGQMLEFKQGKFSLSTFYDSRLNYISAKVRAQGELSAARKVDNLVLDAG